jgi:hypothetical protein
MLTVFNQTTVQQNQLNEIQMKPKKTIKPSEAIKILNDKGQISITGKSLKVLNDYMNKPKK